MKLAVAIVTTTLWIVASGAHASFFTVAASTTILNVPPRRDQDLTDKFKSFIRERGGELKIGREPETDGENRDVIEYNYIRFKYKTAIGDEMEFQSYRDLEERHVIVTKVVGKSSVTFGFTLYTPNTVLELLRSNPGINTTGMQLNPQPSAEYTINGTKKISQQEFLNGLGELPPLVRQVLRSRGLPLDLDKSPDDPTSRT